MAFTTIDKRTNDKNVIWQYIWPNGDRLELLNTQSDFILIEYDCCGNPIPYLSQDGKDTTSIAERYPKHRWRFKDVIKDIKLEYELGE